MAYGISSGAIFEYALEGTLFNQQVMTVMAYKYVGSTSTDGAALMGDILTVLTQPGRFYNAYLDTLSQDLKGVVAYGQWIFPSRYRYVIGPLGPSDGQVETPALGSNVAVAVHRFGDEATRHGSGVLHLPGIPTSAVVNSVLTAGFTTAFQDLADLSAEIVPIGLSAEVRPVLFNRANPAASVEVRDAVVKTTQRVMRRRTVGVGS